MDGLLPVAGVKKEMRDCLIGMGCPLRGMKMFWKLIEMVVVQHCEYTKYCRTVLHIIYIVKILFIYL